MYSKLQKILHWTMSLLIISLLIVGFNLDDFSGDVKKNAYMLHKSFGIVVLGLIPIRLLSRMTMRPVNYEGYPRIHQILMKLSVPILYLMMLGMASSGFIMSIARGHSIKFFNVIDIPVFIEHSNQLANFSYACHEFLAPCFVVLLIAHILAALYHHFILKDDALKRMM